MYIQFPMSSIYCVCVCGCVRVCVRVCAIIHYNFIRIQFLFSLNTTALKMVVIII